MGRTSLKIVLCLGGLFGFLLFLLPACSGEYSKEAFLPKQTELETVAQTVRDLYETVDASKRITDETSNERLVFLVLLIKHDEYGLTFSVDNEKLQLSDETRAALRTVVGLSIDHLWVQNNSVYFWREGHVNGILCTEKPLQAKLFLHRWWSGRVFRLAKHWYCLGEHYI